GYIQHNPFIPTGRALFLGLLPVLQENDTQVTTVRLIQDGNYVVAHNLWENATPFGAPEMVSFDVLRIDDDGYIAEHWDALMPNTPPNPSGRTLTDGAVAVSDLDKTAANKATAANIFAAIMSGDPQQVEAVVTDSFLPDYKQHSPTVADGVLAIFEAFGVEEWVYQVNHKIIGEGNFVLSISEGTAKGVHSVFYDLLRFENGKVAEHWDVIQAIPTEGLANDNGMFGFA
ncbi:MAG: nuclear transport factor 2 family protein, partial [Bacteroidota bacterium]